MFDTYSEIFEERANLYDAAMTLAPEARRAEFEMLLSPVPKARGVRLCDAPAGAGYLWRYVEPLGFDYVAVEPSQGFFDRIPRRPGVTALRCPVDELSLEDESVDCVVSLAGLHHEPDLPAVFAEFRRVLRPDGTAVIADVQAGSSTGEFLNGFVADNNPMGHDGRFLDETTPLMLEGAGFTLVEDRVHAIEWEFANSTIMAEFLRILFGAVDASADQVADAARRILGVREDEAGVAVSWPLRRLVCSC